MATPPLPAGQPPRPLETLAMPAADPAQEALVRALRASFNILRVLMIVLVALYVFSGFFVVKPGEHGLVVRLGRLQVNPETGTAVLGPGHYWRLPDPFDTKYGVPGQTHTLKVLTFMFSHQDAATSQNLAEIVTQSSSLQPGVDGAMFTGDKNLSHGRWEVQFRVADAEQLAENVGVMREAGRELEMVAPLLQRLTETAVVREVASRTVEQVTRTALQDVRDGVRRRLQASLDRLGTGVVVDHVTAFTIEPGAVKQAFDEVTRAENEAQRYERLANEAATKTRNKAAGVEFDKLLDAIGQYGAAQARRAPEEERQMLLAAINHELERAESLGAGDVAVMLSQARSEANQENRRVQREYTEFVEYLKQRRAQPVVTILGLWAQMRQDILGRLENEIHFVPDSDVIEVHVKSDRQRLIDLEKKAAGKRAQGEPSELPPPPPPPPRMR